MQPRPLLTPSSCFTGYGNEEAVGRAIKESSIPREEIFVTTKLGGSYHGRVAEAFENSLKELDLGYIDLYVSSFYLVVL